LVAEVVVDSKLYPGGYEVVLRSKILEYAGERVSLRSAYSTSSGPATNVASPPNSPSSMTTGGVLPDDARALPLSYAIYTLPSSPMHSSGLAADDRAPRHLVRLALPTAQLRSQVGTVVDPLTGETRAPAPRPAWWVDLEKKGAVVEVEVKPLVGNAAADAGGEMGKVFAEGKEVKVESEKEALTSLGREELQDDRSGRLFVLTRWVGFDLFVSHWFC
jgi:hypothetical protein